MRYRPIRWIPTYGWLRRFDEEDLFFFLKVAAILRENLYGTDELYLVSAQLAAELKRGKYPRPFSTDEIR